MSLTDQQIADFKERLLQIKGQITHSLKSVSDDVKSTDHGKGYSQHQADEGTDGFGQTISIEVSSKEQQIIRYIDRCLEKIEEGSYGICDLSGDEIPLARLNAVPYATMTVVMQEKLEKKQL